METAGESTKEKNEDAYSPHLLQNTESILTNLRAENKLLRRKTLNGILEEIKGLEENFDKKCNVSGTTVSKTRVIQLDSDDDEEGDEADDEIITNDNQESFNNGIMMVYGSVQNLVKSLTLSLADPVEKCRELSYESLSLLVLKSGKKTVTRVLPIIIPVLVERLAQPELIEPSEEVRLLAINFIETLTKKCQKEMIPFLDDLAVILMSMLGDPFHEVRIKSCEVTSLIARTMAEVFHHVSEAFVKPLCLSITHQQSRVRRATVVCIGDVLQHGSHKPAESFMPHLIQRLFDSNPNVRKSVVTVVGNWAMEFSDRYSHFHRFLPVILTGLCDESPDVANLAKELWEKIGDRYLEENVEEYKDFVDFPAPPPKNYPNGVCRPNFGCRILTHREVCKLIPGVTHDIMDWQESNREKSAQLLYHLVLNTEEKITMHIQPLFQCMFRACLDSDPTVIKYVLETATLLGYFVPISTCWPLLEENLKSSRSLGCLEVIASYLKGVDPDELPRFLNPILETVAAPDISQTSHQEKLSWMLSICETILALVPQAISEQCPEVSFRLLLTIVSMSRTDELMQRAQGAMNVLRQICGFVNIDDLFGLYAGAILEEIRDADVEWTMNTPERLIFTSILTQAGSGVQRNIDVVLDILVAYLGPKKCPEVRLSLFTELAGILRLYSEIKEQSPQQVKQIQSFVKTITTDILEKSIIWRAGKSAAALRTAALNCLLTILIGNLLDMELVLGLCEDIFTGCLALLDDQLYLNRLFSVKCLGELVITCNRQMEILLINKLYPELLKRMDDEDKDVRLASAKAISQIYENLPSDYTVDRFKAYFEHCVGALIVHLDDHDEDIQKAVFETLSVIGSICPECVIAKCESFKNKQRTPDNCNKLMAKLKSIEII